MAECIEVFCNRRRLHSTLGYHTPLEALTDHVEQPPLPDQQAEETIQDR